MPILPTVSIAYQLPRQCPWEKMFLHQRKSFCLAPLGKEDWGQRKNSFLCYCFLNFCHSTSHEEAALLVKFVSASSSDNITQLYELWTLALWADTLPTSSQWAWAVEPRQHAQEEHPPAQISPRASPTGFFIEIIILASQSDQKCLIRDSRFPLDSVGKKRKRSLWWLTVPQRNRKHIKASQKCLGLPLNGIQLEFVPVFLTV